MTSSSVNRSKSPAVPGNSVSVLANGPTVKNGASSPDQGSQIWCRMVVRNNNLGKEVRQEIHSPGNKEVPATCLSLMRTHMEDNLM